jgi:hypothetical protein
MSSAEKLIGKPACSRKWVSITADIEPMSLTNRSSVSIRLSARASKSAVPAATRSL